MTDFTTLLQPDRRQPATILQIIDKAGLAGWRERQPARVRRWLDATDFRGEADQLVLMPGEADTWSALAGVGSAAAPGPWSLAKAAETLPEGSYRLDGASLGEAGLGWLLGQARFERYKSEPKAKGARVLLTGDPARIAETLLIAEATRLVRDLVDTPASDMGPADLQAAAERVAGECGASVETVSGDALLRDYPMIEAVGRAAARGREPRLIALSWGDPAHPRIALVGKGVVFDSGGLDIKNAAGMRLMKKDMGGAAHALALAMLVMKNRLPVRLQLLIPAVENAISAAAFRPGDVLRSRAGISVEIGNTDAEGRLVLGDALTRASEGKPELIIDFATLTGAARVALGPDLPALFANDDALASDLMKAGDAVADPVWRMPLWKPYDEFFASDVADIGNAGDTPFAGAVTAALFLQRFVPENVAWAHFDTFAWRPTPKPGRPKGGEALSLRAAWRMLRERYRP